MRRTGCGHQLLGLAVLLGEEPRIERRLLPLRVDRGLAGNTRRGCPLKVPVAVDAERAVFAYVDPGPETTTALRSWGTARRGLWRVLRERGRVIELVAVARTRKELNRARTMLNNWAQEPGPSELDAEVSREVARIELTMTVVERAGRAPAWWFCYPRLPTPRQDPPALATAGQWSRSSHHQHKQAVAGLDSPFLSCQSPHDHQPPQRPCLPPRRAVLHDEGQLNPTRPAKQTDLRRR